VLNISGIKVSETPCIKVPKALGGKTIRLVRELKLFDRELKVQQVENYLYIPLVNEPPSSDIDKLKRSLPKFEISAHRFSERAKRPIKLVDMLENKLPPHLLGSIPHAIDFIGDIAVVEIPTELQDYKKDLGEAILQTHKRVNTVLAKSGPVEGYGAARKSEGLG